jgi:hypothetical protein
MVSRACVVLDEDTLDGFRLQVSSDARIRRAER